MKTNKIAKLAVWFVLSIFIIVSLLYYGNSYLANYELSFTIEHKFILFMFATCIIVMIGLSSFIIYKNFKLQKLLGLILEEMSDAEDNVIELSRTTQNMIMRLSNSVGVDSHDKRL